MILSLNFLFLFRIRHGVYDVKQTNKPKSPNNSRYCPPKLLHLVTFDLFTFILLSKLDYSCFVRLNIGLLREKSIKFFLPRNPLFSYKCEMRCVSPAFAHHFLPCSGRKILQHQDKIQKKKKTLPCSSCTRSRCFPPGNRSAKFSKRITLKIRFLYYA